MNVPYPLPHGMTNRGRLNFMAESKHKDNKRHNKQHDARAASFKRIAKAIRLLGKSSFYPWMKHLAKPFDDEAKLLRSMR